MSTTSSRYILEVYYIRKMGKRGPKPRSVFSEAWSPELAYAIGLLTTDGCLSPPGHLIDLTSKEKEQLQNFIACLGVPLNITSKHAGGRKYLRVQFKNVLFYNFLVSIGLTPAKSKTLGAIRVPAKYFWDLLRGEYDGDGSSYAYWDPRWRSSYMFYTCFISASPAHVNWLRDEIHKRTGILGHITRDGRHVAQQLKYAKKDSLKLLHKMYHSKKVVCLSRKRLKIEKILSIVGERL